LGQKVYFMTMATKMDTKRLDIRKNATKII